MRYAFGAGILIVFCYLNYLCLEAKSARYELKTVAEVGGCTRFRCGVKYTDGTYGVEGAVAVGMTVYARKSEPKGE